MRVFAVFFLQRPSHEQVKLLVCSPKLDITLQRYRIHPLHQRVEEFVDADRLPCGVPLREIVTFEHTRYGDFGGQLDDISERHRRQPFGVEVDLGFVRVQNFENLLAVRFRIPLHIFFCQLFTGFRFTGRVADPPREVADDQLHLMSQLLKLAKLLHDYRMSNVNVRRGRIQPQFHLQRLAGHNRLDHFLLQFILRHDLHHAAGNHLNLPFHLGLLCRV
ncbi:hypothetical protein D3C81_1558840 [compost metagenome]